MANNIIGQRYIHWVDINNVIRRTNIYSITRVINWKNDVNLELDLSNLSHQLTFTLLNKSSRFHLIFNICISLYLCTYKIIMMTMMMMIVCRGGLTLLQLKRVMCELFDLLSLYS